MPWRFRKSIKIAPGVRVNFGKRGMTSLSVGGRGGRTTFSRRGTHSTFGIPGTGLSYRTKATKNGCLGCFGCLSSVVCCLVVLAGLASMATIVILRL